MTSSAFLWSFTRSQSLEHFWRGKSSFWNTKTQDVFREIYFQSSQLLIKLKFHVIYTLKGSETWHDMLEASFRQEVLARVTVILLPLCFRSWFIFLKSWTTVPKVIHHYNIIGLWGDLRDVTKSIVTNINVHLFFFLEKKMLLFSLPLKNHYGSFYVSEKLPTYPSPKLTWTLTSHLGQSVGLGEG